MSTTPNYNDGEIHAWSGGECPVHPKSVVDVSYGQPWRRMAKVATVDWSQPLLFRVTEQHIEPPKPLELWVNVYENGQVSAYKAADIAAYWLGKTGHTVHMIEVTE